MIGRFDSRVLISQLSVRSNDLFSGHERRTSDYFGAQWLASQLAASSPRPPIYCTSFFHPNTPDEPRRRLNLRQRL